MYRIGYLAVPAALRFVRQHGSALRHHALRIGRDAAGHNQRNAFPGALGVKGGEALCAIGMLFQTGVH